MIVRQEKKVDRIFLMVLVALVGLGLFIFLSASFGLLLREDLNLSKIIFSQIILGIGLGTIAAYGFSRINYKTWRRYALIIFCFAVLLNILVFVPGVGMEHGGATRWIHLGSHTFQPSEVLKIASILILAAWLSTVRDKISSPKFSLIPFLLYLGVVGALLLSQPDTATYASIVFASIAMFVVAGGRVRDILILIAIGLVCLAALAYSRPYVLDRILTFTDPSRDPLGSGYQIQQSLIAIGSGGFAGRGFGQSVQKFAYLPEPTGDSIFSVAAEEFGFMGSSALVIIILIFGLRGLIIASKTPDTFGGLVVVGIVILIVSQSFVNISSMLGILPLSGLPLIFVSHGGTAMLLGLAEIGIVLNISRQQV